MKMQVPNGGDRLATAKFLAEVSNLNRSRAVEFSFQYVDFVTPGWMLLVVRALREFRENHIGTRCKVIDANSTAMSYAAHAGFFDALGVQWSRNTVSVSQTSTFIPITFRKVRDLFAGQPFSRRAGDVIQEDSERLSSVLTQSREGTLFDTLSYSIREIIRNIVEHSKAEEFMISAQCWLALGSAEIAIADPGIGIFGGLTSNGKYRPESDAQALSLAIQPGVSGKIIPRSSEDAWVNSGYGLHIASELADGKHGFTLASGSAALIKGADGQEIIESAMKGTCVVLRLRAGAASLEKRLSEIVSDGDGKPSRASTSVKVKSGT